MQSDDFGQMHDAHPDVLDGLRIFRLDLRLFLKHLAIGTIETWDCDSYYRNCYLLVFGRSLRKILCKLIALFRFSLKLVLRPLQHMVLLLSVSFQLCQLLLSRLELVFKLLDAQCCLLAEGLWLYFSKKCMLSS